MGERERERERARRDTKERKRLGKDEREMRWREDGRTIERVKRV